MRILQLTPQIAGVGGIATYVRGLTNALTECGHECVVFSGEPVSDQSVGDVAYASNLAVGSSPSVLPEFLAARVNYLRPDVILVHVRLHGLLLDQLKADGYPVAAFVHSFACSMGKVFRRRDEICTHAVSARCLWDWYSGPCGSTRNPLTAIRTHRMAVSHLAALRRLPVVLVGSDFMKTYLVNEGLSANRISVDNWVPPLTRLSDVDFINTESNYHSILYVGRLTYDKGVHHLLDELAELGDTFSLRIVGDGWHRTALEQRCLRLGIRGSRLFHRLEARRLTRPGICRRRCCSCTISPARAVGNGGRRGGKPRIARRCLSRRRTTGVEGTGDGSKDLPPSTAKRAGRSNRRSLPGRRS